MLWITNAMLERILFEPCSCLPSSSRISINLIHTELGIMKCSFSSSLDASEFLLSKESEILKIVKLSIIHHWGEVCEGDTETQSWSNESKKTGDHEWKLYSSNRLTTQYHYANESADPSVTNGNRFLSPLLASSIIQEAEIIPAGDLFEVALRKTESVMEQRKKRSFGK